MQGVSGRTTTSSKRQEGRRRRSRVRYKEKAKDGDKWSQWLTVEVSPVRATFNAGLETPADKMGNVV